MTSPALRPYQRRDGAAILAHLAKGTPSTLYVLPTRGGKTVVAADVMRTVLAQGWEVLFLAHRQEIIRQTGRKLADLGLEHGVIMPGADWTSHPVHVASIDTLKARGRQPETRARLRRVRLVIVDEAHHSQAEGWAALLAVFENAQLLGLTATPFRLDGQGLGDTYQEVVRGPSIRDLIADGYLVQPVTYAPRTANLTGVRKVAGDFNRKQAAAAVDNDVLTKVAAQSYARFAPGVPSVWFCTTIEHAQHVAQAFARAGWRTACVHGGLSDEERYRAIYGLADRSVQVLTSCEIISEGVDLPYVGVAGLLRPTMSTALYMQQGGRVLTPDVGKSTCTILDLVGNFARHGLVDQDRPWTLDGLGNLERQVGALRRCGRCHRVMELEVGVTRCPSCGRRFPRLGPKHSAAQLALLPDVRGVPAEEVAAMCWDDLIALPRSREDLQAIARIRGYRADWVMKMAERLEVAA